MNRIVIPHAHFQQLRRLDCDELQAELDRADVLPAAEVPEDVVTMHSKVSYVDESNGERRRVTLVYPEEADVPAGRISVLAPVGAALLGLSRGQSIDWEFPKGIRRRLRVLAVTHDVADAPIVPHA
jgi:regulator of nucleoside diphosphate kinase